MVAAAAVAGSAALGAGGSILSGGAQSAAATKARRSQEYQFNKALNWDVQQYEMAQERAGPWVRAGQEGIGNMRDIAYNATYNDALRWQAQPGLDPSQYRTPAGLYGFTAPATVDPRQYQFNAQPYQVNAGQYRFSADPYTYRPEQALDPTQYRYTPTGTQDLGSFTFRPPTVTDDPGYQFRLQQGVNALDASAAARGGLGSGAAQRALQTYGQQLGSQEYQAAYGRSWQQQQEQYERQRLMNMTEEERQRYAEQANYQRALQANMTTDERQRYAMAQNYQQQFGANQFNANLGFTAAQQNFARDYQVANDYYNRLVQQQQAGFTQGLAVNDLAYQRAVGEQQRNWQMDLTANEMQQARAYQAYQAEQARRQQMFNQWASIAGQGQTSQGGLTEAGTQSGRTVSALLQGLGTAQATNYINQANATTNMYSGVANAFNQGLQNYLTYSLNNQQQTPRYTGDAPGM